MKVFTLLFFFLFSTLAFAQAPLLFNYQGVARDNSGVVLTNKDINIKIGIIDEVVSGSLLYSETHNVTTNQFGLFTLMVGDGTVLMGNFEDINWGTNPKFIKVDVDINGGNDFLELGTIQLLSVPYALHSETSAKSLNDSDTSPTNEIQSLELEDNVLKLSESNSVTLPTQEEVWRKSDVGIGTPSLVKNTYIENSIHSLITNTSLNGGAAIALDRSNDVNDSQLRFFTGNTANTNTDHWNIGLDSNPTNYKNDFTIKYGLNGTSPYFVIKEAGNVGIGTTESINSKLQVRGGDVYIEDISSGIILKSPNGNCWRVTVDDSGTLMRTSITCP